MAAFAPWYGVSGMAKKDLIRLLAGGDKPESEAADELARAVESILKRLRRGEPVPLPGVGRLVPGKGREVRLEPPARRGGGRGRR